MYSSGNNAISGSRVGIGINNPQASLHIKDFSVLNMSGIMTYLPLIRFQSTNPNAIPLSTSFWDLSSNGQSSLTFSYFTSQNTNSLESFKLSSTYVKVFTRFKVGEYGEYGSATTPDNTQGYVFSLGMKEQGSGAWQGAGIVMFGNTNGEFHVVRNKSNTTLNGLSVLNKNSLFKVGSTGLELYKDPSTTRTDITFKDTWGLTGEQRTFVIRANSNSTMSNAPNTLEFFNMQNNGQAHFSMPVRIGGPASDVSVINSNYDLYVEGGIRATTVKVDAYSTWPDYVFETNYDLMSLKLTEKYILANKHLPGVPSAKEVQEDGIELAEMNAILLQKIEELTLHLIELQKQVNGLVK